MGNKMNKHADTERKEGGELGRNDSKEKGEILESKILKSDIYLEIGFGAESFL
jgi:hypothetical protein